MTYRRLKNDQNVFHLTSKIARQTSRAAVDNPTVVKENKMSDPARRYNNFKSGPECGVVSGRPLMLRDLRVADVMHRTCGNCSGLAPASMPPYRRPGRSITSNLCFCEC